jgi:(E)-4-hydroxy-3-methylbut-2-enyl-diphosphate synthase
MIFGARPVRRLVRVGSVPVGGGAPVSVQSMTKTDTRDVAATVAQIHQLTEAGCDIVRLAVPDLAAARALGAIKAEITLPLVADIHFNHRLALEAIRQGADKIRLNPGNLRKPEYVSEVARRAGEAGVAIRVGVNAGSLPPESRARYEAEHGPAEATARAMLDAAKEQIALLEAEGFHDIVVSAKAFDVPATVRAYQLIAEACDYPLHIGITEAGLPPAGTVRSAVGLGLLLAGGLGDTLRVSLPTDPVEEVRVGRAILGALNLRRRGLTLVVCPTCGRCEVDLRGLAERAEQRLADLDRRLHEQGREITVAIMGCVVNGPGEAREAHVGVAAGKGRGVIFSHGHPLRTVEEGQVLDTLVEEIEKVVREGSASGPPTTS